MKEIKKMLVLAITLVTMITMAVSCQKPVPTSSSAP